jgi:hypothetical protein
MRRGSPVIIMPTWGGPVVAAIAAQDLVAAGVQARRLDRVLVGLGAAEREEEGVDVTGHQRGEALAEARARGGGQARGDEQQVAVERLLHLLQHLGVRVADVDAHQLAVEVEVALTVGGVKIHALGALDGDRRDGAALRPRPHRVLLAIFDDLLGIHSGLVHGGAPQDIQVASLLSDQREVTLRGRVQKRKPS